MVEDAGFPASSLFMEGFVARRWLPVDPADAQSLAQLTAALRQERLDQGLGAVALGRQLNRSHDFVTRMEGGAGSAESPQLSSFQHWAWGLGLRLEFGVEHFWLHAWSDQEMLAWFALSRRWDAADMSRMWLVSALRLWRLRTGVSSAQMAAFLRVSEGAVCRWEGDSTDPTVLRTLAHARAAGTRVTWQLWRRDEWIFG